MTDYDIAVVTATLAGLDAPAANTVQLGDRMQDLAVYLLDAIPGVTIKKQKSKNFGASEETDIWFQHRSGLPFSDFLVPVECKNEAPAISSGDISRLGTKISNSGGADGLFIARTKLAGSEAYENGHLALLGAPVIDVDLEFSGGLSEARVVDVAADVLVDGAQRVAEFGGCGWLVCGQQWS